MKEMISVPKIIFEKKLSNEEIGVLTVLIGLDLKKINMNEICELKNISTEIINTLVEKDLLKVLVEDKKVYIVLTLTTNTSDLDAKSLDRISFLISRPIRTDELEKIRFFIEEGYTLEDIELAIHKSVINGVDNFNYVAKVLETQRNEKEEKSGMIKRNIEIY